MSKHVVKTLAEVLVLLAGWVVASFLVLWVSHRWGYYPSFIEKGIRFGIGFGVGDHIAGHLRTCGLYRPGSPKATDELRSRKRKRERKR